MKPVLVHVSEQMVVMNLISGMIRDLSQDAGWRITVIAPTPVEEKKLGYDGLFSGLPHGNILALQFKRPYPHPSHVARYTIRRDQCEKLASWFHPGEALHVSCPYVWVTDFLRAGEKALANSAFTDTHRIWNSWTGKKNKTRTAVYLGPVGSRNVRITDPRRYDELESESWESVLNRIRSGELPPFPRPTEERRREEERPFGGFGRTLYVHRTQR